MPLALTDELKTLVNDALANGAPLLLAAVSPDGKPVLSFRGSVQTYSDDQLGLWARNSQGGTLDAIRANPNVVLVYRSPTTPVLQFHGRARVANGEEERSRVFDAAPDRERGTGGAFVNVIAYKADYTEVREDLKLIEKTARTKKCSSPENWQSNSVVR